MDLSVLEHVSIVGYDDVPMAAWPAYDLTTLRQPVNQMVSATVSLLMEMINGDSTARKTQIEGPLVVRGSARIPEGWT
jgi:DNA-binding LacI/PurR family transcriptional regulator